MYLINKITLIVLCLMILTGCASGTGPGGDDRRNDDDDPPTTYTLSVNVDPSGSGTVDPSSGTFEEGTSVTVEASANEGWEFGQWTGDMQSTDNPLTFTINQNTTLTANFADISSDYSVELTVRDSLDSIDLVFGQAEQATGGFDSGMDQEAPPPPPPGAFYAYFNGTERRYYKDFRNTNSKEENWNLQFAVGSGDSLSLAWSITQSKMDGTLTLTDTGNTFEVDMNSISSYAFAAVDYDSLVISYSNE